MTTTRKDKAPRAAVSDADAAAFRNGIVEMIPALRAFARALCRHRDQADDLAQETLAKAWQARDQFQHGTNLKAWLFVILRNEFYSTHRHAKTVAHFRAAHMQDGEGIEAEQYAKLDLADLMRAFNKLSPEHKEVLALTMSDFSSEDAAAICGCAVGTIKSRLFRARKQLETLLNGQAGRLPDRDARTDDAVDAFFRKLNPSNPEKTQR
jgi:RNA polymerase sigma-70 factor, ECF subfamily